MLAFFVMATMCGGYMIYGIARMAIDPTWDFFEV